MSREPGTYRRPDGRIEIVVDLAESVSYVRDMWPDEVAAIEGELDIERLARAMHDSVWSGHWLHEFGTECPDGQNDADAWRRKAAMTAVEYRRLSEAVS